MGRKIVRTSAQEQQKALKLQQEAKKRKKMIGIASAIVIGICVCIGIVMAVGSPEKNSDNDGSTNQENYQQNTNKEPYTPEALDENLSYYADIEMEKYGTITVLLDQKSAPITCANFVELANRGFYDGLTFHRVEVGSLMQGGDPKGNGTGGSEHKIVGEFTENGYENNLLHTRGAISMARMSDYNSATSQFFIMQADSTSLDGKYAVFGYVTEGIEIVDAVSADVEAAGENGALLKATQPVITSIKIRTE